MKGQVRGLALELLRQDCVDCLVVADEYEGVDFDPEHLKLIDKSEKACRAYDDALHNDICVGCYRSASEITTWKDLDNKDRKQILAKAQKRELTLNVPNSH